MYLNDSTKTRKGHIRTPTFAITLQIILFRIPGEEDAGTRSYPDTVEDVWMPAVGEHAEPHQPNGEAKSIFHVPDTQLVQESSLRVPRVAVWN